jgi:integrase
MASVVLPYLNLKRAKGRLYGYYRRNGKTTRVPGDPASRAFRDAYEAIHAGAEQTAAGTAPNRPDVLPGSLRALVQQYKASGEYRQLTPATQKGYMRILDPLLPKYGDLLVRDLHREWITRHHDALADTPRKANYFVSVLSVVLSWGLDRGFGTVNVAARIKKLRGGESYRPWTLPEIDKMIGAAAGRVALPVLIGLYTAQRRADVLKLPWSAYDGRTITLRQSKAREKARIMVIPVHPTLKAALDAAPKTAVTICARSDGHSWKVDHFAKAFAKARRDLSLPADLQFHGLRHTAASRLAEAGASDAQVQAITGHETRAMVEHYTAGAKQKKLARDGMAKLPRARKKNEQ